MQPVGSIGDRVDLPIDQGLRPVREVVCNSVRKEVELVAEQDGARFHEARLATRISEADLHGPIEHEVHPPHAFGNGPQIGPAVPREMMLHVVAETRQPRAQRRVHVAPIRGEQLMGKAIELADDRIGLAANARVADRIVDGRMHVGHGQDPVGSLRFRT